MSISDLTGQWTGVIIYGKKYHDLRGQELYFDAEITQHGDSINGTAIDTGGAGASPDAAVITGSYSANSISFVKKYSSRHFSKKGELIIDKATPGPDIFYNGIFDESSKEFKGIWKYKIRLWFLGLIPFRFTASGTWTMRRK